MVPSSRVVSSSGPQNVLFPRPFHGFNARILLVALRRGLLPHPVAAVGELVALEGDLAVEAGGAGGLVVPVDLLEHKDRALQTAPVLGVDLFDGEALSGVVGHGDVIGAARLQGDAHPGDGLTALGRLCLGQGEFFVGGEAGPGHLSIRPAGAGDGGAPVAGEGKLSALQRTAARSGLDDLQAGGAVLGSGLGPLEGGGRLHGGVGGVGDDVGLLGGAGIVGQEQVELGRAACGFDGEGTLVGHVVGGDADLEGPVILLAVGVQAGGAILLGVYLIAGGSILLDRFQGRIIFCHKDGALRGIGGVDLGGVAVDPGGGGGGHIHHPGVILLAVDGFLFDAIRIAGGRALQAPFMDDLHARNVLIFLGPDGEAGV